MKFDNIFKILVFLLLNIINGLTATIPFGDIDTTDHYHSVDEDAKDLFIPQNIPADILEEDHCHSMDKETYSQFNQITLNTDEFVDYMGNLCRLEIISVGPQNYFSVDPSKQRIQVNGYIRCSNDEEHPTKIRIEGLNGSDYYQNLSLINSPDDLSAYSNYPYTNVSSQMIFAMIPKISDGSNFHLYVMIEFYNGKEKTTDQLGGGLFISWTLTTFIGEDSWINC